MKEIVVIGASGHAAEIQEYLLAINRVSGEETLEARGYIDDDPAAYERYDFNGPYLGKIEDHEISKNVVYAIGIANLQFRRVIVERFRTAGARFVTLVHPSAYISASASFGEGCIIGPNVNVGPNVRLGIFNLLNSRCSLGHDTVIGDFNFISPNVSLSGGTVVGDDNLFGINSATKPEVMIGSRNKIEAGMVMDRNIADDTVVFFRYKEKIIAVPKQ